MQIGLMLGWPTGKNRVCCEWGVVYMNFDVGVTSNICQFADDTKLYRNLRLRTSKIFISFAG